MLRSMRAISGEQWALLAVALALIGGGGFTLIAKVSGTNGGMPRPPKQAQPDDFEAALRIGLLRAVDGHSVICHPEEHHSGYTYTNHRYPRAVGGEVSHAIHHGFSMMGVPSGTPDEQWIVAPPSEVAW